MKEEDRKGRIRDDGGTSLAIQGLRLHDPIAGDSGSIPGQKTKIPYTMW